MKKIVLFVIILLLFLPFNVFAATGEIKTDDITSSSSAWFYNINNTSSVNALTTNSGYLVQSGNDYMLPYYTSKTNNVSGSYGSGILFYAGNGFKEGVTYSVLVYLGMTNNTIGYSSVAIRVGLGTTVANTVNSFQNNDGVLNSSISCGISGHILPTNAPYTPCTWTFTARKNSTYIFLPFNSVNNTNNVDTYFYGYTLVNYGTMLSNSQVQQIIDNSNLATATDVNEINKSIDVINNQVNDINNTLNDDTPPNSDISGLGNVQGLLKPGPVDSLLNIPTEFLSTVVSSFGGQCKPLSGTWVYDKPLTFPCFNEIIWDDFEDDILLKFFELIPCAFILITYFKHLYKKVERATSMSTNSDDEWGVI